MTDTSEYIGTLRRAFVDNRFDYITIDGRSGAYLRECNNWLLDQGLIYYDKTTSERESDSQWTVMAYRLTDKGKKTLASADGRQG